MKKFLLIILVSITLLGVTSCETYAQAAVYDDGIIYEYSYNDYPVRYIDGIAYYYGFCDNVWNWYVVPSIHIRYIVHHPIPMRYHPHHHGPFVNNIPPHRPAIHGNRPMHNNQPRIHNNNRPPQIHNSHPQMHNNRSGGHHVGGHPGGSRFGGKR